MEEQFGPYEFRYFDKETLATLFDIFSGNVTVFRVKVPKKKKLTQLLQ